MEKYFKSPQLSRPLIEECPSISLSDLKRALGRRFMLRAVRNAEPINFQMAELYLVHEEHRLPGRNPRWSDLEQGDVRLWMLCVGCRRKVRRLYSLPFSPLRDQSAEIRCRKCHGLQYASANRSGNAWWKAAMRIRRLLKERQRLITRKQTAMVAARVEELDMAIFSLKQRIAPKTRIKRSPQECLVGRLRSKRTYKDLALLGL